MIVTYINSRLEVYFENFFLKLFLKFTWKICNVLFADVFLQIYELIFSKNPFYKSFLNFLLDSAGVGRTGIFIALSNSIEQMNIENAVNIFQIVKKMREQRSTKIMTRVRKLQCIFCLIVLWLKTELREASFWKCFE